MLLEFYEVAFPTSIERSSVPAALAGPLAGDRPPRALPRDLAFPGDARAPRGRGGGALLDVAALAGKYGKQPQRSAEELLDAGLYHAACSDAHRPVDADAVQAGIRCVQRGYGDEEVDFLFREGPLALLEGRLPD